jgi:L-alanine-DL-glutamate epimerase-like enolase superfamily enzyme
MTDPKITKIEIHAFRYELRDMGLDADGFNMVYEPGGRLESGGHVLRLFTDSGPIGESVVGPVSELATIPRFWHYLKGKNALQRERIYDDIKRALRQSARIGVAPIDIALWDLAGKLFDVPIYRLLGGYKESVPCYASTYHGSLEPHIDFVLADATDYVRGDINYDGITGVMKLAHAAESLGIDIEFHGPSPAARQCMAAIRNTNYYEMGLVHPKAPTSSAPELYIDHRDELDAIDSRGHVPVGQAPGLGAHINWDWVEAHRTGVQTYD